MNKHKVKSKKDTRQRILEAASKIISQKGVMDTSLADIANEVGISKGTLYYYFSSKNDVIYDITEIHLKQMTEDLMSWIKTIKNDAEPKDILLVVIDKLISDQTRGKLHLYLVSDAVIGDSYHRIRFIQKYKEWRKTLEDGIKMVLKDKKIDYKVLSYIILAAIDGFTIQRMLGIKEIPIIDIAELLSSVE